MSEQNSAHRPRVRGRWASSWVRRFVVVVAMVTAAITGLSSVASADVITEGPGVRARADWSWGSNAYSLDNISLGVRDLACDGKTVGVRLRLYYQYGGSWLTQMREYTGGCGGAQNWSSRYDADFVIAGVRVVGCVIGGSCYESEYHPRP